jgi:EAL domain-containing protein (putative c-di-GMP-specific phosphodiesterase class I)
MRLHNAIPNLKQVIPHFQAIFSADSHCIIGYEILGRMQTEQGVQSLGSFFHDPGIPDRLKMEVDLHLQTAALETFLTSRDDVSVFMNMNANHLILDKEGFIQRLISYRDRGLELSRVVVEITEHDFRGDIGSLSNILKYLKTLGVKIAIDDLGKGASNLDRIGILEPDILKVDIHSLKNDEPTNSYHGVIYSLALLSRKIGAELLFEGIESKLQFHYSWRKNGRYFQGYFFSKPTAELIPPDILKHQFRKDIHHFIHLEQSSVKHLLEFSSLLNERLQTIASEVKMTSDLDEWLWRICPRVSDFCFRMYITDCEGFQITSNVIKENGGWIFQKEMKGKNWSWRPYFIENLIRMTQENRGILSDFYSDIATGEQIRTFSFPLDESRFLFIDIPSSAIPFNDVNEELF